MCVCGYSLPRASWWGCMALGCIACIPSHDSSVLFAFILALGRAVAILYSVDSLIVALTIIRQSIVLFHVRCPMYMCVRADTPRHIHVYVYVYPLLIMGETIYLMAAGSIMIIMRHTCMHACVRALKTFFEMFVCSYHK